MGERKVLNKYFPPDFDPAKIPRTKKADINPNFVVRMMLPMTVRCNTCGEYMYKGKKFNSRKENVDGPEGEYLGIPIFRFYFKCSSCSAEFTIKTDPKNMDYAIEHGAKRNFEMYKEVEAQKKAAVDEREASEKDDKMAQLENKTKDSKMEMEILDGLDEIRTLNGRNAKLEIDAVIASHRQHTAAAAASTTTHDLDDDDEAAVQEALAAQRVKRLREDEPGGGGGGGGIGGGSGGGGSSGGGGCGGGSGSSSSASGKQPVRPVGGATLGLAGAAPSKRPKMPVCAAVPKPKPAATPAPAAPAPAPAATPAPAPAPVPAPAGAVSLGLGAYDSSGSSGGD